MKKLCNGSFDLDCCVSFVTNKASKILSESLNNELMKHGITKSQWIAMYYINRSKGISQHELAILMNSKESTITGILDRIEVEGLIQRSIDKIDKRKKLLTLTQKGVQLTEDMTLIAQDFRDSCLSDVSLEHQQIFLEVLDKMVNVAEFWESSCIKD